MCTVLTVKLLSLISSVLKLYNHSNVSGSLCIVSLLTERSLIPYIWPTQSGKPLNLDHDGLIITCLS